MVDQTTMAKQVLVLRLISKYRTLGFFHADLDPLKRHEAKYLADLDFRTYGFTDADLDTEFDVGSFKGGPARMRLRDLHAALRETYTRTIGLEYMYISDTPIKRYVQERVEPTRARGSFTVEERRHILERLTAAETLERYLHTKYVGQKRFSGEGGDTMIPMLDRLIQRAGRGRRAGDRDGDGAPRPPQRARQRAGQDARRPVQRVRGQGRAGAARPATSSTTRASRRTSRRRAARRT
jgi:2-oxoglutarate dehydrogenase E1 component